MILFINMRFPPNATDVPTTPIFAILPLSCNFCRNACSGRGFPLVFMLYADRLISMVIGYVVKLAMNACMEIKVKGGEKN